MHYGRASHRAWWFALLTIIDEALANVVENNKVTVANLAQVISYVTPEIRHEFPEQLKVLEELHSISRVARQSEGGPHRSKLLLMETDRPSGLALRHENGVQLFQDLELLRKLVAYLRCDVTYNLSKICHRDLVRFRPVGESFHR